MRNAIYTFGKKYTRCGAVCPGMFLPVLMIEGKLPITGKFGRFLPKGWPQSCFVASIPSKISTQCQSEASCFWMTHQCWVSDLFNNFAMRRIDPLCMEREHGLPYLFSDAFTRGLSVASQSC